MTYHELFLIVKKPEEKIEIVYNLDNYFGEYDHQED
jgi:hypothetical protein